MLIFIIFLVIVLCILSVFYTEKFINITIRRKVKDMNRVFEREMGIGIIDEGFISGLNEENVQIESKDGLKLYGKLVVGEENGDKCIIISHGITSGIPASYKYARPFIEKGWNVLFIYHRRHVESEGRYSTMGFYEKYDISMWMDFLNRRFGDLYIRGIHGESMGASSALMVPDVRDDIDFIIEDCGYSDFNELLRYKNKNKKDWITRKVGLKFLYGIIKLRAKFNVIEVSPIESVAKNDVPILFIHGKEDKFVPTYMCFDLYEAAKGYKEIYICEEAVHANSMIQDYPKYKEVMMLFVEKAIEIKKQKKAQKDR